MRSRLAAYALGASVAIGPAAPAGTAGPAGDSQRYEVPIQALQYLPETLKVKRGAVVVWVNKDPFPHTVTARGAFDSGSIAAGKSWRYTARVPGVYPYVCTLHSNMKGTLQVE